MGKYGRFHTKGPKEFTMLTCIGKVVLSTDNMGDAHRNVIHNINKMKDRFAIGTKNDKVLLLRPFNQSAHFIINNLWGGTYLFNLTLLVVIELSVALPFQPEENGTILLRGATGIVKFLQVFLIYSRPLTLKIRAKLTTDIRALVPI